MKKTRMVLPLGLLGLAILVTWWVIFRPHLPPAERGRRIAERVGCFSCHGPEGTRGAPNPGRPFPSVPNFESDLMMFAEDEDQVREWIRDGVSATKAKSKSWQAERNQGVLEMPAFGDRLSRKEIGDLVAFVMTTGGGSMPEDALALHGMERAKTLGCFGCHGPGGRFARANSGSLKGYIPSWDGQDFPDLVRDRDEFAEWVENGVSARFERNPLARFFLNRAVVEMPAYKDHLEENDVDAMWAYVLWLRSEER